MLVNNAAVQIMGPLHEFTGEQFDQLINVNMKGVFFGCKYALPIMMKQKAGVILSVSSVLGLVGDFDAQYQFTYGDDTLRSLADIKQIS